MRFQVPVVFWSYCRDLTGVERAEFEVGAGGSVGALLELVYARFPSLASARKSLLVAVGVDYQTRDYVLKPGDEVSLFPPVQGG